MQSRPRSLLAVVYGQPLSGKSSVARELARMLPGPSVVVSTDALLDAIAVPGHDVAAELEMVHTQARLLVANYMKNRYHVVIEGAFFYKRGGVTHRFEQEIDQLLVLMRNMTERALLVRLSASDEELRARAAALARADELDAALGLQDLYKRRHGPLALTIDTTGSDASQAAEAIKLRLTADKFT